ncbi:BUD13 homolog [Saccostrea echinata]|uniref:BUD13 homolog n=1 Tax=Saccostrea echinata TaxID=191078 RepID=UPI002A800390|nr:BUD13 homolog [Saccostrea echinata]
MSIGMSKEEYLKRYTSDYTALDKRKKRRKKPENVRVPKSRIVDDDIDLKTLLPSNLEDTSAYDNIEENVPTVAAFMDERPKHIQELEAYTTDKWKGVAAKDENLKNSQIRKRHDSDSSTSPIGRERHDSNSDQSPPRKGRHDSNSDQSPPRKGRHDSDSDQSPQRNQRHESDSDQSPQRNQRHESDSDQSPQRNRRHESDSDQSPQRNRRHDSDSDQSPPRKLPKSYSKKGKQIEDAKYDHSVFRKSNSANESGKSKNLKDHSFQKEQDEKNSSKMNKTLSGKKAGLSSAKDMKTEADVLRRKEDETFKQISSDLLGKDAKTQYRKSGRQQKKKDAEPTIEEIKRKEEIEAKHHEWGKGIKQTENRAAKLEDHLYEMSKPLARARDDKDLDAMLKDMERADDPMLAFIKKKKSNNKTKKELPKYKGPPPPPNRFGIMPGYRWDGVDRSNGFERSIYAKLSDKKAVEDMAYKWSVEDM